MRYKEPFTLFIRKLPSGSKVYYYSIYDNFNKRKQYSTGCTRKNDAKRYYQKQFQKDRIVISKEVKFVTFTKNWFDYDNCQYIQSKLIRGGTYSKKNAEMRRSILLHKMVPFFGNMYMKDIMCPIILKRG